MTKAVLFDLDNTLYDGQQYFLGASNDISKYISAKYDLSQHEVYETLVELWRQKTSMHPYLFNDLLNLFHLDQDSLKSIVKIFNEHSRRIEPYPDVVPILRILKERDYKLGIITDGNIERQKRKIESLRLKSLFDVVIYSKEVESKPSPRPFLAALDKLRVKPSVAFYVADNPLIDFQGARRLGIRTIRILRGEFSRIPGNEYIDSEIEKLDELLEITK